MVSFSLRAKRSNARRATGQTEQQDEQDDVANDNDANGIMATLLPSLKSSAFIHSRLTKVELLDSNIVPVPLCTKYAFMASKFRVHSRNLNFRMGIAGMRKARSTSLRYCPSHGSPFLSFRPWFSIATWIIATTFVATDLVFLIIVSITTSVVVFFGIIDPQAIGPEQAYLWPQRLDCRFASASTGLFSRGLVAISGDTLLSSRRCRRKRQAARLLQCDPS